MVISYLAIGALLMFTMEVWINPNVESSIDSEEDELKFNWITRGVNILIWPVTFAIILKHTIQYIKNILK